MSNKVGQFILNAHDFDKIDRQVFDLIGWQSVRTIAARTQEPGVLDVTILHTYKDGSIEQKRFTCGLLQPDNEDDVHIAAQDACYQVVNGMLTWGRIVLEVHLDAQDTRWSNLMDYAIA